MGDPGTDFVFTVGYRRFHGDQLFNYQLNRPYSLAYARARDLEEAGRRIRNFADWKAEMTRQAMAAEVQDRLVNAAFHYRVAEFYTFPDDPDKERRAPLAEQSCSKVATTRSSRNFTR